MEVFIEVVRRGSFSEAGRRLGMSPSAVSKLVARLEGRLRARLLTRTTRRSTPTPEGAAFYERACVVLTDIQAAEAMATRGELPAGRVRVSTSASYAVHRLAHVLPEFLAVYPHVDVDLDLTDAVVDLISERADIAIRAGPLSSSSLMAKKLGASRVLLVASPKYLEAHGVPRSQGALSKHVRLGFGYGRQDEGWTEFGRSDEAPPRITATDGETLRQLALAGVGIAAAPRFCVAKDLESGRLVQVLRRGLDLPLEPFHAVHVGRGGPVQARVRALLDFLAERGRVN